MFKNADLRRASIAALFVAVTLSLASRAADDPGLARELATQGEREFSLGNWSVALGLFERAYRAKPLPALLYNTAQCHRLLGNLEQARRVYRAFLDTNPKEEMAEATRAKLAELQQALDQQGRAAVSPPQTVISAERPAPLVPGQLEQATKQLAPRATEPRPPPSAPEEALASPAPDRGATRPRVAAYSCLGASAVAVGAAAFFGVSAAGSAHDWATATNTSTWQDARDSTQAKARLATISWVAAGVLGAAGLALFLF
ncbi:MAG: hypothetical protein JST92_05255 [Deltaproteobacteria bacterium]|nr:hypothetical protein [Deltaproteobacteria bacterium]